jgi:hypothetical protein
VAVRALPAPSVTLLLPLLLVLRGCWSRTQSLSALLVLSLQAGWCGLGLLLLLQVPAPPLQAPPDIWLTLRSTAE